MLRLSVYLTIIPSIFEGETYHESIGIAGLHYIAFGLGVSLASQVKLSTSRPPTRCSSLGHLD